MTPTVSSPSTSGALFPVDNEHTEQAHAQTTSVAHTQDIWHDSHSEPSVTSLAPNSVACLLAPRGSAMATRRLTQSHQAFRNASDTRNFCRKVAKYLLQLNVNFCDASALEEPMLHPNVAIGVLLRQRERPQLLANASDLAERVLQAFSRASIRDEALFSTVFPEALKLAVRERGPMQTSIDLAKLALKHNDQHFTAALAVISDERARRNCDLFVELAEPLAALSQEQRDSRCRVLQNYLTAVGIENYPAGPLQYLALAQKDNALVQALPNKNPLRFDICVAVVGLCRGPDELLRQMLDVLSAYDEDRPWLCCMALMAVLRAPEVDDAMAAQALKRLLQAAQCDISVFAQSWVAFLKTHAMPTSPQPFEDFLRCTQSFTPFPTELAHATLTTLETTFEKTKTPEELAPIFAWVLRALPEQQIRVWRLMQNCIVHHTSEHSPTRVALCAAIKGTLPADSMQQATLIDFAAVLTALQTSRASYATILSYLDAIDLTFAEDLVGARAFLADVHSDVQLALWSKVVHVLLQHRLFGMARTCLGHCRKILSEPLSANLLTEYALWHLHQVDIQLLRECSLELMQDAEVVFDILAAVLQNGERVDTQLSDWLAMMLWWSPYACRSAKGWAYLATHPLAFTHAPQQRYYLGG